MALNLDTRQRAMLHAMGITVWLPEPETAPAVLSEALAAPADAPAAAPLADPPAARPVPPPVQEAPPRRLLHRRLSPRQRPHAFRCLFRRLSRRRRLPHPSFPNANARRAATCSSLWPAHRAWAGGWAPCGPFMRQRRLPVMAAKAAG